jgi:ABC-type xylose transport system substrate-binding protein
MDPEERKIAALIAAFDTEHERVKGAITALNQTGAQLKRDVTGRPPARSARHWQS